MICGGTGIEVITKPQQHDINRAGKRLLREVLEPFGVVNEVQEDYGIDSNVQVFDAQSPTGAWFHVQLKSSANSPYSADRSFISQELPIDHARHFALEMRQPVLLVHADATAGQVYWYAPQLDRPLAIVLNNTAAKSIRMRIPTNQRLPDTAADLLLGLDAIYLVLANRELTSSSNHSFADSLRHMPNQEALHRAFQEKTDTLKLQNITKLYRERKLDEARPRAETLLNDPDSTIEMKFWARIQLEGIEFTQTVLSGKPQSELSKVILSHSKALQRLTRSGPSYLKFFSLIKVQSAELGVLVHENFTLFMAEQAHTRNSGNPLVALSIYARRSANTKRLVRKYNQCLRLARYAASYRDRWMLGRALTYIVSPIGEYLITLTRENTGPAPEAFARSALQICKLAAWICEETGDAEGVVLTLLSALSTIRTEDSEAFRWVITLPKGFLIRRFGQMPSIASREPRSAGRARKLKVTIMETPFGRLFKIWHPRLALI
jgi:hypothetical protein